MSKRPVNDPAPTINLAVPWVPAPGFVPPPGTMISGTYQVRSTLGTGGMGAVLRCWDRGLARDVAVKLIHPDRVGEDEIREQFLSEARAMARLRHENVVGIHAFGEYEGVPYFVMEYVPGTDLAAWLEARPTRPLEEAVSIVAAIACGVGAIHAAGVIHRDLKPANVLVAPDFRLVVGDLGLAQQFGMTTAGTPRSVYGTPRYMAPEMIVAAPEEQTPAVDAYALGILAYELLTGCTPFPGKGVELLTQHVYDDPIPPRRANPDLPEAFEALLLEMLAKDPRARPTVEAFGRAMQAAISATPAPRLILVADDDRVSRECTVEALQEAFPDARVVAFDGGQAALDAALREPPSIAVLDLHMPGVGGADVAIELRAHRRTESIPIVVLSGVGGARDWQMLRATGVQAFLVKPVDPDALIGAVRRALGAAPPVAGST
jgi:serine/threonine-protein kinase